MREFTHVVRNHAREWGRVVGVFVLIGGCALALHALRGVLSHDVFVGVVCGVVGALMFVVIPWSLDMAWWTTPGDTPDDSTVAE